MDDDSKPNPDPKQEEEAVDDMMAVGEPPASQATPEVSNPAELPSPATSPPPKSQRKSIISLIIVVIILIAGAVGYIHEHIHKTPAVSAITTTNKPTQTKTQTTTAQGLQLDTSKNYGNKYADGILPVGDGKYSSTTAKAGYVYTCSQYASNLSSSNGGASTRGPWFTNNNTEYDINKKSHVAGSVMWKADFTNTLSGSTRTIVTNDLPSHPTGVFPIASTDPAYAYDRNPNSIKGQTFTYSLVASPTYNANPNCMGGEAGVMLTGVALFNGFDAGGRDAGAWEVQDNCSGHPQSDGIYHYHTLSSCIKDTSVKTVIGYALDGFPITGPQISNDNILTTSDLDECHGITSAIVLDGKTVTMYHYVMTQDFPYSISCFRGTAIQPPDLANKPQGQVPSHP